jgi:hypothetical protein
MVKILIMRALVPDRPGKLFCKNFRDAIKDFLNWLLHPGGEGENQIRCVIAAKFLENKTTIPFPKRDILNFNTNY